MKSPEPIGELESALKKNESGNYLLFKARLINNYLVNRYFGGLARVYRRLNAISERDYSFTSATTFEQVNKNFSSFDKRWKRIKRAIIYFHCSCCRGNCPSIREISITFLNKFQSFF